MPLSLWRVRQRSQSSCSQPPVRTALPCLQQAGGLAAGQERLGYNDSVPAGRNIFCLLFLIFDLKVLETVGNQPASGKEAIRASTCEVWRLISQPISISKTVSMSQANRASNWFDWIYSHVMGGSADGWATTTLFIKVQIWIIANYNLAFYHSLHYYAGNLIYYSSDFMR